MQKKNLLVLASTFPRFVNDTEPRFVYDLCLGLKKEFNIIVLTSHYSGSKTYEEINGLKIYRYRYAPEKLEKLVYNGGITTNLKNNKLKYLLLPTFFISQLVLILKLLKNHPISIIHAHWLIPQGFLALIAINLKKTPPKLLCTSHGSDLFGLNDPLSVKIKKWVLKNSDVISVVSSAMKKRALELVPEIQKKISIAPMGTDLKNLFIPNEKIIREKNLLLFVGRIIEGKGINTLIHSLIQVNKQCPDINLIIIGEGPKKNEYQQLSINVGISQSIHFIGKLTHSEIAIWYARATLAVFPFQQDEGLGLVMIEALGCACPVIAGDVPAVHDVIEHEKTGLIVDPNKPHLLAENIIQLLLSPEKRQYLAGNGRKHVCKNFSWDKSIKKYIDIINHLQEPTK